MSGLEGGAAVFSLVVGVIEIIHRAIEVYEAVNDKSGIPKALKKVSEKLPSVEEILKNAEAQYKAGDLKNIDKDTWANAEREVEKCKQACQELHDLLQSAYPKADASKTERLWKGTKTVLSGKGKTAEVLLKEISDYLTFLAQRKIVNNAALLEDIKSLVEELCPETTTTHMHNVNGDNIGTLHGDKNVNSGSGFQFTGANGTYNFGGAHNEGTQYALLSLRHQGYIPFSEENSQILRKWLSSSYGHSQSLTVSDSSRVRFEKVYRRISDDDPIATYQRLRGRKAANTTGWLVEHEVFRSWLSEDSARHRLWLSGKVGSGKSTLVTTVIDKCLANLKSGESSAVLMFFFNSHDDTALSFFESLTKQLIATLVGIDVPSSREILSALETAYGNDISRPHIAQVLEDLVVPLCQLLQEVTLVIDGIDECRAAEATLFWDWLRKLLDRVQPRILITSEDQANVSLRFKGFHRIQIDQQHNQFDIDTYINQRIASKSSAGQVLYDESLRDEVKVTLQQKANGMFLWIHLVLNIILEYCETPVEVKKAVEQIPPDLETVYSLCLENRRGNSRPINANLFLWACAAPTSLSIGALGELLAMDLETGSVDPDQIPFAEVLLRSGAGLMTLDPSAVPHAQSDERLVTPVHSTVRNFIFSERFRSLASRASHQHSWPLCVEAGQWREQTFRSALGSLCLIHIKRRTSRELVTSLHTTIPIPQPGISQILTYAFPRFAIGRRPKVAKLTVSSALIGRDKPKLVAERFLQYAIENWLSCNTSLPPDCRIFPWVAEEKWNGRSQAVPDLFEEVAKERNDSYGVHPWDAIAGTSNSHLSQMFAWAVANNHLPLLRVVKRNRHSLPPEVFNLPLAQHDQMLALHVAAKKGFALMIAELVPLCDANAVCVTTGKHVLHFIAEAGDFDCLQPLLRMEINWRTRDNKGQTPLSVALRAGHNEIVRALLSTGIVEASTNLDDPGVNLRQPPQDQAILYGSHTVLQLLLKTGKAEIDAEDIEPRTLRLFAEHYDYERIVQQLLKTGMRNINTRGDKGRTPLGWAAYHGHTRVAQLLLDTGQAEINVANPEGWTPLLWAVTTGHDEVAQLLLATGKVEINTMTQSGQSRLLLWAASKGDGNLVRALLGTGNADLNTRGSEGRTPLCCAARFGHEEVIQLLLATGKVDVTKADKYGEAPLYHTALYGYDRVVQRLLETGKVNVNASNIDGETPLYQAAKKNHVKVVQLLLETGKVDVNATNIGGKTPLYQAAKKNHVKVVQLLLETGKVDVNIANNSGLTPISTAAVNGNDEVVQLLLETGKVDIVTTSINEQTLLYWAAFLGHDEVVRLLLETGNVDINAADKNGETPLHSAASRGHDGVVQLLVETGKVEINRVNGFGQTPIYCAREKGQYFVVYLLEEAYKREGKTPSYELQPRRKRQ